MANRSNLTRRVFLKKVAKAAAALGVPVVIPSSALGRHGIVAPSNRTATATVLAAMCILMSLTIHVFGQSNPGLTNYMHAFGESLGAVIGVAATFRISARLAD